MNFQMPNFPNKLRTDIVLSDRDTNELFSDKLRFIFLQLPCFTKEEDECQTDFERWIYVLKNMETFQRLPFKARKSVFEKLEQIVDIASLSKEDRMKYDESIKVYRDHLVTLDFAKQEGLELGTERGRNQFVIKSFSASPPYYIVAAFYVLSFFLRIFAAGNLILWQKTILY